jgi:hypothetical protein
MNDHEFEERLRTLAGRMERPDPTPGWKADILAQARLAGAKGAPRSPRWLLTSLGAAWLLIGMLRFTTPAGEKASGSAYAQSSDVVAAKVTSLRSLMAIHSHPELLDLP